MCAGGGRCAVCKVRDATHSISAVSVCEECFNASKCTVCGINTIEGSIVVIDGVSTDRYVCDYCQISFIGVGLS